jgi:hypothetical protein
MSYACYKKNNNNFEGFLRSFFKALNTEIINALCLVSPFHFIIFSVSVLVVYLHIYLLTCLLTTYILNYLLS